ncbi:MAG: GTP-binding protein [Rhodothermia bacterium]
MRIHVLGGFLGAGKTTLIRALTSHLSESGERVAVVMNDQGHSLVDTRLCLQETAAVDEITGGCFCCRYDALDQALLSAQKAGASVVIAEAVGSCTDLVATVLSPLAQRRPEFEFAPLTIAVDPWRVNEMNLANGSANGNGNASASGNGSGNANGSANGSGSDNANANGSASGNDVAYLFRKQIQEADVVALTRSDLAPPDVYATIAELAPHAAVVRTGLNTPAGLDALLGAVPARPAVPLDIDYERYANAEASLGWGNAVAVLEGTAPFNPVEVIESFFAALRYEPVAHVKVITLDPVGGHASFVRRGTRPVLNVGALPKTVHRLKILVNARVELSPAELEVRLRNALADSASPARVTWEEFDCFQPDPPTPTHRHAYRCGSGDDASCCAAFYDRDDVRFLLGESWHPGGLELTLDMAGRLDLGPGRRLLDVACGGGTSLRAIQSQWPVDAVGLDADADADADATAQAPAKAGADAEPGTNADGSPDADAADDATGEISEVGSINFQSGDAHALPFDDQEFDAVLCECALSTFADQRLALEEIRRVLRPGGRVALSDMTVSGEIPESLREWVHIGTCLQGALDFDGYSSLIEAAGLRLVEEVETPAALSEMLRRIKRNLVGLALSQAAAGVPSENRVDVALGRSLIKEAEQAVADGVIGYGVYIAERAT